MNALNLRDKKHRTRLFHPVVVLTIAHVIAAVSAPGLAAVIHVPADFPTIQEALTAAVAGDEIIVAPGTYNEAIDLLGKEVYLHSSDGYEVTLIDADGLNTSAVTCIEGAEGNRTIAGFTIAQGRGVPLLGETHGGGLFAQNTTLTLVDCMFSDNRVEAYGGAVYSERSTLEVERCLFTNNDTTVPTQGWVDHSGGAIATFGGSLSISQCTFLSNSAHQTHGASLSFATGGAVDCRDTLLTVVDCMFVYNTCDTFGGAIATRGDVPVLIEYCTFIGNEAQGYDTTYSQSGSGGAIGNSSPLTVQYCQFEVNEASRSGYSGGPTGGAIRDYEDVIPAFISDCTFIANRCIGEGGALAMSECSTQVQRCVFESNSASRGGAFYIENADPIIQDCTMSANIATSGGGAVMAQGARPRLLRCDLSDNFGESRGGAIECQQSTIMTVEECTFTSNICGRSGGALYVHFATLRAYRCVFTTNVGEDGGAIWARSSAEIHAINCILDGNTAGQNGAAVFTTSGATVSLYNCLTHDNVAGGDGNTASGDSTLLVTNSILWDDPVQVNVGESDVRYSNVHGSLEGEGNIEANPLFLDTNERYYRLTNGSPCIDAGSNDLVPVITQTDADGLSRFVDDSGKPDLGSGPGPVVDIGPFEYQETSLAALTVLPTPVRALFPLECLVTRAQPRARTWLLYSTSGSGSTYIEPLDVTVDMRSPQYVAGPLISNATGNMCFRLQMPGVVRNQELLLQAVQQGTVTNYVETRLVQP
ncbi:MAG: hypothetical protein D8M59_01955 [Planctomycetes bacterium]|nr:hypothetical protein [Planctomycetota bacterium]NOG54516.1 hypothetical protein [Planctomycetota bacterium]